MKEIYLDHAATTPVAPEVRRAMENYWERDFGNPGSLHRAGRRAKEALDAARQKIARILNCRPDEIVFTGSGTEAINLAIFGTAHRRQKGHLLASKIEHHAVLEPLEQLEKEGFEATYLDVDEYGLVNPADARKALRPDTILISVMCANNEIGTIEPVEEIGKIVEEERTKRKKEGNGEPLFFHTDACQAAGVLNLDVQKLKVDLLALNGSKIYGPKGAGCLFVRRGIRLKPIIFGGGQEYGLRSGTENVPAIIGLAKALEIAEKRRERENARLAELRDYFIRGLLKKIPKTVLNGHPAKRLPNNINVSVLDIEGEAAVLYLDEKGIYCSTGSACTSESLEPSHVILAIGRPYEYAHGSLRFTLGRSTSKTDIDCVLKIMPEIAERLRKISPVRMEVGQKTISHPEAFAGSGAKIKAGGKSYK